MKEIKLKLETIKIDCEVISIKTDIIIEESEMEIIIPEYIRMEVEQVLIDELKR